MDIHYKNQHILNFEVMAVHDITQRSLLSKKFTVYLVIFGHLRSLSIRKSAFVNNFGSV